MTAQVNRPNEPPMPNPLAFFLTCSTYGTWLPGDQRGWVEYRRGWKLPDPILELEAKARMTDDACILDAEQRLLVENTVADHCRIRGWELHAVNCRTNHLHIVVSANRHPNAVRTQIKAWCTRRLKELERQRSSGTTNQVRENWWAERGSRRYINDDTSLEAAIRYVRDGQDGR
jgi:REP element-mobilizing transposase RayT